FNGTSSIRSESKHSLQRPSSQTCVPSQSLGSHTSSRGTRSESWPLWCSSQLQRWSSSSHLGCDVHVGLSHSARRISSVIVTAAVNCGSSSLVKNVTRPPFLSDNLK